MPIEMRTDNVQDFRRLFADQKTAMACSPCGRTFFEIAESIKDDPRTSPLVDAGFDYDKDGDVEDKDVAEFADDS